MLVIQGQQGWGRLVGEHNSHLPPAASTFAESVDGVYELTYWLCAFFFVLIMAILLYSIVKWRRRTPDQRPASLVTHNTALEVTWTVIPLVLIMVLFAWGWRGSLDMTVAPADCLQYEAQGRQWSWGLRHPGETRFITLDKQNPAGAMRMYVPVGKNVKVILSSSDVLHAFFVPGLRVKRDVLPGRYQFVWFNATRLGSYPLFCAEYCGQDHSYMIGTVEVCSQAKYETKPWRVVPEDPIEWGEMIYSSNCASCHTKNGQDLVGPSFKGLWGREETLTNGQKVTVDKAYLTRSLRNPEAERPVGYDGKNMTAFGENMISEEEIDALVKYMETLK